MPVRKNNRRGDMTLFGVCLAMALLTLFYPMLEFLMTSQTIDTTQQTIQKYTKRTAVFATIEEFNDVKQAQRGFKTTLDESRITSFKEGLCKELGLTNDANVWKAENKDYQISNVAVTPNPNGIDYVITYDLTVPVKIMGQTIDTAKITGIARTQYSNRT